MSEAQADGCKSRAGADKSLRRGERPVRVRRPIALVHRRHLHSSWLGLLRVLVAAALLVANVSLSHAEEIVGRASVIDADTIEIHKQRIRLHGVDAPEGRQTCFMPDGSPWRCGQQGALALSDFLSQSMVSCRRIDTDRYGRMVARCATRSTDISWWLVSKGWAMAYKEYSTDYVSEERAARAARLGIWVGTVLPPWEWRRQN